MVLYIQDMRYVYYPSRYVLLFAQGYRRLYHYSEQQRLGHNFDTVHRVTFQKDRQSTDKAKEAVHVTIIAVEKQQVGLLLHILSVRP